MSLIINNDVPRDGAPPAEAQTDTQQQEQHKKKLDRAAQSRVNGAKSRGPVSPEGRFKSSCNSWKTGIYAKRALALSTEDQAQLDALRESYHTLWRPRDEHRINLVDQLTDADWRHLGLVAMEKWLVEDMMSQMKDEIAASFDTPPPLDCRAALAYDRLYKTGSTLDKIQREALASSAPSIASPVFSQTCRRAIPPSATSQLPNRR